MKRMNIAQYFCTVVILLFIVTSIQTRPKIQDTALHSVINELYAKQNKDEDHIYLKSILNRMHTDYRIDLELLYPFSYESYTEYYYRMFVVYSGSSYLYNGPQLSLFANPIRANQFATNYLKYQQSIDALGNELFTSMGLLYVSKDQTSHYINVVQNCIKEDRYQQWSDIMLKHGTEFYAVSVNSNVPYEYLLAIGFQEMMTSKPSFIEDIWTTARIIFDGQQNKLIQSNNPLVAYLASSSHSVGMNSIRVDVAYDQYLEWHQKNDDNPLLSRSQFQVLLDVDPVFNTSILALRIMNEQSIHSKDLEITDNKLYIANTYNGNPLTKYYGEKVINYMNALSDFDLERIR